MFARFDGGGTLGLKLGKHPSVSNQLNQDLAYYQKAIYFWFGLGPEDPRNVHVGEIATVMDVNQ